MAFFATPTSFIIMAAMDLDDPLLFLRRDYVELMLTYQMVEDYLFQSVYGYLRYGHNKDKNELQDLKTKSLNELKDIFFTTFQVRSLPLKDKQYLGRQFHKTVNFRNYYTHQFFSDVYLKAFDASSKAFDEEKLDDINFAIMDEKNRIQAFYDFLCSKFGKHDILALRNFSISDLSVSLTFAELPKDYQSAPYAKEREEAFIKSYWNLAYGYFVTEASLFAIVERLENHFHFLSQQNAATLSEKSLNEYRKLLILAVKKEPLVHILVSDCLSDLSAFAHEITALQLDRNYWFHFCLQGKIGEGHHYDFSAFCSDSETYNKLSKSLSFCEKTKQKVFALEDSLSKKLP